ncbi:MAG: hypothetical protein IJD49_05980 [Clostridia bacterium]|nr:hypothetical protein [Clostridia bacterium]
MKKLKEWISIRIAKSPGPVVLSGIILANVILFLIAATVIYYSAPSDLEAGSFGACVFYTISMILDAGCIQYVIQDMGNADAGLVVFCLATVILGMIVFTGAVIGYISNWISAFIDKANSGNSRLSLSNHTVILNWNTRASEIINDFLYKQTKETIIVFAPADKERIEKEIYERLDDTIAKEKENGLHLHNKLSIIVREGETYSTKQLNDICVSKAKSIIILSAEITNNVCKFDYREQLDKMEKGNAATIKTLVQVAHFTAAEDSADNQQIIVEVNDDWTLSLVNKIIDYKTKANDEQKKKCNIVPIAVNRVLGQILSQFSIMPELNSVYNTLFSNNGAAFYAEKTSKSWKDEEEYIESAIKADNDIIPLTLMTDENGNVNEYFMTDTSTKHRKHFAQQADRSFAVSVNDDYRTARKNIVILGHNSKCQSIMEGFNSYRSEWQANREEEILNIIVIDDEKSLEKLNYYKDYPYVKKSVVADIYDKDVITSEIKAFVDSNTGDTSVLILSDDSAANDDMDSNVLTYLVYLQDIIAHYKQEDENFDPESIDIVAEILNPKNYDVVHNYSVNNIIISNRYISKMVCQLSEKKELFDFYNDILSYDDGESESFTSKELYVKSAEKFYNGLPAECSAFELVKATYEASPHDNKSVVLGYVSPGGKMTIFGSDLKNTRVELKKRDKIIMFSNH